MKPKIVLILMALACALGAVLAHAKGVSSAQIREWRAAADCGETWVHSASAVATNSGSA